MAAARRKGKDLYVAYTNDEYELPVAVEDTAIELAQKVGISIDSLYSMLSRHQGNYYKVKENDE